MSALEELVQAALNAPTQRRDDALQVLRGQLRAVDPSEAASQSEPYITLRQLAKRLGFSTTTLTRWRVPSHEFGGKPRFRFSEVEQYLKSEEYRRRVAALRAERKERAVAVSAPERSAPIAQRDGAVRTLRVSVPAVGDRIR